MRIIDWEPGAEPRPAAEAEELCIDCGHCVAACPHGALDHRAMAAADCPPLERGRFPGPEEAEQLLRGRRSIRVYRDEPLDRGELAELIRVAGHAPSGHNLQPVHWLVMDDRAELARLAGLVAEWMRGVISADPALAAGLHLERVVARWENGEDPILRGAPAVVVAHGDKHNRAAPAACTIAAAYLELYAAARGLGACWAGFFNAAAGLHRPLAQALELPPGHAAFASLMVGRPRHDYHRLPLRRTPRITWRG
jgi:nitroreductase